MLNLCRQGVCFALQILKVVNTKDKKVIGDKIELADTFFARFKGLLGRTGLQEGQGILLIPCSSIHCIGMKFAIDVIFMDIDRRVIRIRENMKPGTSESGRGAYSVLEVAGGVVKEKGIQIGDVLHW